MTRHREPLAPRRLAAFLEGEVTRSEADAIEAELAESATARRQLERLGHIRQALTDVPHELDGADLVASVRAAIAVAPSRGPRRTLRGVWWSCAGLAAAAVVLGLVVWKPPPEGAASSDEFRAKSAGAAAAAADRWIGIAAFRVRPDGVAQPLAPGAALSADDGLVFRYTNLGPEPFGYLMVFGVDAAREVHWYYPAFEVAGSDPTSLVIQRGGTNVTLPDVIHHKLAAGRLAVYAVFTREPLQVLAVERDLAALFARGAWDPAAPPRLPFAGSGQDVVRTSVAR